MLVRGLAPCLKLQSELYIATGPGWGPYVPLWDHMGPGPYWPIWAQMGPYGSSWTGLGRSGHVRFPTFGRILHVLGSKLGF